MIGQALIEVQGVTVRFGGVVAVEGVSLDIASGERLGLIGPNGAGKSTLLGVIGGQVRPARGRMLFDGVDISRLPPHRRARMGIARTFQDSRPFASLTARQAVEVSRRSGADRHHSAARTSSLLEEVGLGGRDDELCQSLSYVDRKRLEVARALGTDPRVLLLDEPFSGLTSEESHAILRTLDRIVTQRQLALVIVEHVVRLVLGFCHRVVVLDQGAVIADGKPSAVREDAKVIEAYLGRATPEAQAAVRPAPSLVRGLSGTDVPYAAPESRQSAGARDGICLAAGGLQVSRGGVPVLHGVGVDLRAGEVRCLLGPNGAGKTTLMEVLAGLLSAEAGNIWRRDQRLRVTLVHQSRALFSDLSLRDNLLLACHRLRRREAKRKLAEAVDIFPWISQRMNVPAGNLSGGEQQMLSVARAILTEPAVLLLDEPSIGVAPLIVQSIIEVVRHRAEQGCAVLISEQAIDYVLRIASYGYILEHGQVVLEGSRELLGQSDIVQAYFGAAGAATSAEALQAT